MARGAPVRAPDSFGAADARAPTAAVNRPWVRGRLRGGPWSRRAARCGRAERGIRVGHETVRRWVANFDEHGQALDALV